VAKGKPVLNKLNDLEEPVRKKPNDGEPTSRHSCLSSFHSFTVIAGLDPVLSFMLASLFGLVCKTIP